MKKSMHSLTQKIYCENSAGIMSVSPFLSFLNQKNLLQYI